jgi:hypothetical protein
MPKKPLKYLYRLWLPGADIHELCFDKICEKCQNEIDTNIKEHGVAFPNTLSIDTSVADIEGLIVRIGSSLHPVTFCKNCTDTFMDWLSTRSYLHYGAKYEPELWRSTIEE